MVDKIIKGQISPSDLQCFCYILNQHLKARRPVEITHIMIHYSTGVSERQVSRSTKHLATLGILNRERAGNEKYKYWCDKELLLGTEQVANGGVPNIYIINILEKIITPATDVHPRFISYYCALYKQSTGVKYTFRGGQDGSIVSALLEDYSYDELTAFAKQFFKMDNDFIRRAGRHLGVFKSQIPVIVEQINQQKKDDEFKDYGIPT